MKALTFAVSTLLGSMILVSCQDYPPTQTGGAPEGFTSIPTQAEVEICAKYAQDQSISAPSESSQDAAGAAGTGADYERAYKDCMSKRGY